MALFSFLEDIDDIVNIPFTWRLLKGKGMWSSKAFKDKFVNKKKKANLKFSFCIVEMFVLRIEPWMNFISTDVAVGNTTLNTEYVTELFRTVPIL